MKLPTTAGSEKGKSKDEAPKSLWDKVITATPVVMTVVATVLAGLSSSEMSQSQYFRSYAAQVQAKASDQWNLFQAKRQRAKDAAAALDDLMLRDLGNVRPFAADTLAGAPDVAALADKDAQVKQAVEVLAGAPLPPVKADFVKDEKLKRAYDAAQKDEAVTTDPKVFLDVNEGTLRQAIRDATTYAGTVGDATDGAAAGVAKIQAALNHTATAAATAATPAASTRPSGADALRRVATDFAAAKLHFESARENREAKANQVAAYLYEVSIQKSSVESERHRTRSRYFFFGMLGAQAAVTIASVALAAKERSTLWILAASIGVIAVAYAGYVYLFT